MKTYFVTACVYAFLNAYHRWHRERASFRTCSPFDPADLELFDAPTDEDIAQYALVKVKVNEACSDKTDYQRAVLVLRGLDYTHAEIAEILGKNASAIERLLGRVRNTAVRNGAAERRTQRD
jgi:DNA-directed RNA polymerase specialized sigma24 family protein